jgi:hypothetical protein
MDPKDIFDGIQGAAPEYPDYTCVQIDKAILEMQGLRETNIQLRRGLQFWRDKVKELLLLLTEEQRQKFLKQE